MAYSVTTLVKINTRSASVINGLDTTEGIKNRFRGFVEEVYSELGLLLLAYSGQREYPEQWELRLKYLLGGHRASSPGGSWHNFGRAIDIVPVWADGSLNWNMNASGWARVAKIASKWGLTSGASFGDPGHFKYTKGVTLPQLRSMKPGWEIYTKMESKSKPLGTRYKWIKPALWTGLGVLAIYGIFTYTKARDDA